MRARTAVVLLLAAFMTSMVPALGAAHASGAAFAQEEESEGGGDEQGDGATDSTEGSGRVGAEVGANEGQTEEAVEETGPPWTYQMARMILALVLLIGLAIAFSYWKLVVQRQRRGI